MSPPKRQPPSSGFLREQFLYGLRRGVLRAVSGPEIDSAYQYRSIEQDIRKWRDEQLTSSEVKIFLGIKQRTLEAWVAKGKLKSLADISGYPHWFTREDVEKVHKRSDGQNTGKGKYRSLQSDIHFTSQSNGNPSLFSRSNRATSPSRKRPHGAH